MERRYAVIFDDIFSRIVLVEKHNDKFWREISSEEKPQIFLEHDTFEKFSEAKKKLLAGFDRNIDEFSKKLSEYRQTVSKIKKFKKSDLLNFYSREV